MKLNIFQPGPLEGLARYISANLGVQVIMQGCHIHATPYPIPTIVIPNMEGATQDQIKMLTGFVLHEAFHFAYSNFPVLDEIEDYLTFQVTNQLEDEFIERKGEKRYLGAREYLVLAHQKADEFMAERVKKYMAEAQEKMEHGDGLGAREKLLEIPQYILKNSFGDQCLAPEDKAEFEKHRKLFHLMSVWMNIKRRYQDKPEELKAYHEHPWSKIIDKATEERARSTRETVLQAKQIISQCGLTAIEAEHRPIKEFKEQKERQKEAEKKAREFERQIRTINREMREEIKSRTNKFSEKREFESLQEERREASTELAISREAVKEAIIQRKKASAKKKSIKENYKASRKALKEALKSAQAASKGMGQNEVSASITNAVVRIRQEELRAVKNILDRAQEELDICKANVQRAKEARDAKKDVSNEARTSAKEAKERLQAKVDEVKKDVEGQHEEELSNLNSNLMEQQVNAESAEVEASYIREEMDAKDKNAAELADEQDLDKLCHDKMQEYKGETVEELDAGPGAINHNRTYDETATTRITIPPSRKYVPFTRRYDHVMPVNADEQARRAYAQAKLRLANVINEAVRRLRRIKSPIETRVKFNVEEGRLDARYLRNIILRSRGIQTDVERIWKRTDPKPKPQVAVQVVLDCSNSMADKIGHTRDMLVVLNEVFKTLKVPLEVIGHTTDEDGRASVPYTVQDIKEWASRVVPFRGYLFKEFKSPIGTEAVFANFQMDDNLDGEAALWAAERLCERTERVKLMLFISDGVPNAPCSHYGELQRHLYQVCKSLEAYEGEGLVVHGIGIGNDAIGNYFKNHSNIDSAEELTKVVIDLLEKVLIQVLGLAA